MPRRVRKLVGSLAIVLFVIVYAPVAMALAESRIREAHLAIQTIVFIILGLVWVLPVMPVIRWMEKPDRTPG